MAAFVFITLLACRPGEIPNDDSVYYYDIRGLLKQQLVMLDTINPTVLKKAVFDGKEEFESFKLDSAGWVSEFELFMTIDLNKPMLYGIYRIDTLTKEDGKFVIQYQAREKYPQGLESLKIVYKEQPDMPDYIQAVYQESNPMYRTERKLSLFFKYPYGAPRLASYEILGTQKMIMKPLVSFEVESILNYDRSIQPFQ